MQPRRKPPEPGADLLMDEPRSMWNRCAVGMLDVPIEVELTDADLLVLLMADGIVAAEECRWRREYGVDC